MTTLETFGWDVVYASTFAKMNQGLQKSGQVPISFKAVNQEAGTSMSGAWSSWRIVPGSVSNRLNVQCTVGSGTAELGKGPVKLAASTWTVQFGLILAGGKLAPAQSGEGAPRIVAYKPPSGLGPDVYKLIELFDTALQEQVKQLAGAFASVALNKPSLLPDRLRWLAPTAAAFASESFEEGDPKGGVFALLAMTRGRSAADKQVAVDRRLFSGAPAGADAAIVLGPSLVVGQFLTPAIVGLVQGARPSDFSTDRTGTVLFNANKITWGGFEYQVDDSTKIIHPVIPRGNLELALDGEEVHLSMSNIHFDYPGWDGPGSISISFDTEQFLRFEFIVRDDGGIVMVPQLGKYNSFNVTVVPSRELQIFQIAVDVALQILFAILGGIVDSALGPAESAAEDALEEAAENSIAGEMSAEEVGSIVDNVSSKEIQAAEESAAENAGEAIVNQAKPGFLQKFKSALMANRWKILMKIIEKAVEIPAGQITNIAVWTASEDYGKLPSLGKFATDGLKPVSWKSGSSFKPKGGALEGALVFWGEIGK